MTEKEAVVHLYESICEDLERCHFGLWAVLSTRGLLFIGNEEEADRAADTERMSPRVTGRHPFVMAVHIGWQRCGPIAFDEKEQPK